MTFDRIADGTGRRLPRSHLALLCASIALGVLACAINRTGAPVAPQAWRHSRGPVVPHDSFPRDCSLCHTGSSWQEIREDFVFDHHAETGVALVGAHASAECLRCHNDRGPVERFAARGCVGCHEDVHRGQLGRNCSDCHDDAQSNWIPRESIAMHNRTRFPLVGAHATTACFACHPGAQVGNFSRTDTACLTCHRDDLAQATSPDHQAQGWVDNCHDCHIPTTWGGAGFNHPAFPLTGAHAAIACNACHVNNVFEGTPSACVACHLDDYQATSNPNHAAAGFPTTCESCHGTVAWEQAKFAHTSFPLTGAHAALACSVCHAGGVFDGTPSACVACHLDDYQATTSPSHTAAGFPTTCESCHGTSAWKGAAFDHPFPITSGKHVGLACADCHVNPGNFGLFSCLTCHEHSAREMDDEHRRVPGYVYQSSACYGCHPSGKER